MKVHKSQAPNHNETVDKKADTFISTFMNRFESFWSDFDLEYDEMDKRIKERKKLNGKATHHEIDL